MNAIRVTKRGGPEVLLQEELPLPDLGPTEALVRLEAIGVNYIDTYQRSGIYKVALPFTPGSEAAGVVEAVGAEVSEPGVGDRVAYAGVLGAYATHAVVPAARLVEIPDGVETLTAAAVMLQGMTAHYLSHTTYPLKEGDTALVHAAAGGVGLLLVQMAKMRGARVIGTVSTQAKASLAAGAGADHVILYTSHDFEAEAKRFTDGRGVQVVYDGVGKTTYEQGMNCLVPRGYFVLFGAASGPVPPVDPQILSAKGSLFLTRPTMGHYTATRDELLWRAGDVLGWVASGRLKVRIDSTFPLANAGEAHHRLESRQSAGKILLVPA
ncbi:MAG TPA: quinone oxidoreductase [bacterium]|nr:quinone oxidoreductase [bacterium]